MQHNSDPDQPAPPVSKRNQAAAQLTQLQSKLTLFKSEKREPKPIRWIQSHHNIDVLNCEDPRACNLTFLRAAGRGDIAELETLLQHGVDINYVDSTIGSERDTPLHNAVRHGNALNVLFLLSLNVNLNIRNSEGKTAAEMAFAGNNDVIKYMFNDWAGPVVATCQHDSRQHSALATPDILSYILTFMPVETLFKLRKVSRFWKNCVRRKIDSLLKAEGLIEDEIDQFYYLPKIMQYLICKCVLEWDGRGKVKQLLSILKSPVDERIHRLYGEHEKIKSKRNNVYNNYIGYGYLGSDHTVLLYIFGFLNVDQLLERVGSFCTEYAAIALVKRLITVEEMRQIQITGWGDGLRDLLSEKGLIALYEKLITPQQAAACTDSAAH